MPKQNKGVPTLDADERAFWESRIDLAFRIGESSARETCQQHRGEEEATKNTE